MSQPTSALERPMLSLPTDREELAKLALDAAGRVRGVARVAADPTGRWSTTYADTRLAGVVCMPLAEGGYTVELHLVARLVPLLALADEIRERVGQAAARGGLGGMLRQIDVAFEDLDHGATP